MSDKELEEYINKIEPNFDSHLEKGTIEMSNEYYNLLEEKMVRIIDKNQELKKQLEEKSKEINRNKTLNFINKVFEENTKLENQQKEFIEYMNKTIGKLECDDVDDEEMKGYLIQRINTFKEILSKYKEIIGENNEKDTIN